MIFRLPTATETGRLGLGKSGALTSASALDVQSFFINDTWNRGRTTVNVGVRYDRYSSFLPEQQHHHGPRCLPLGVDVALEHAVRRDLRLLLLHVAEHACRQQGDGEEDGKQAHVHAVPPCVTAARRPRSTSRPASSTRPTTK